MNCIGKKMNVLGDSITAGAFVNDPANIYCNRLKERLGFAEVRNYGSAGSPIAAHIRESGEWSDGGSFYERAAQMDPDADIVLMFGGTNDFGQGNTPLGEFSDRTTHTFYGACHLTMLRLLEMFPAATIVILTPTHRRDEDNPRGSYGQKPFDAGTLADFVKVIREVAAYYALPVLDLYTLSGMNPNIPLIRELYCPDELHFNDAGHARLADRIEGFLKAL